MSGDSFKPEEGGEVEVINPEAGNNEIDAQPDSGDAMTAAELEAAESFTSTDDEATEEEIETEEVTKDPETAVDETAEEAKDEVVAEDSKLAWDGNPDNLPEELQDTYKSMLRGFHTKTKELADARRKTEDLQAQLLLKVSGGDPAKAEAEEPPPLPTGENITQEQWNEAITKQSEWFAKQNLEKLENSGQFVSAEQHAKAQRESDTKAFLTELSAMPGYTDEVAGLMAQTMANDPFWATAADSREGMMALADRAIAHVGAKSAKTVEATKAAAKITKQATAASRATPRVTTPKGASAEDTFAKTGFKTEDERMAHAEKDALEKYGG